MCAAGEESREYDADIAEIFASLPDATDPTNEASADDMKDALRQDASSVRTISCSMP